MSTKRVKKFPCKCGHRPSEHRMFKVPIKETWCVGDMVEDEHGVCQCESFRPDNLAYLEKQYWKKHKKRKGKGTKK